MEWFCEIRGHVLCHRKVGFDTMIQELVNEFNNLYERRNFLIQSGRIRDGQLIAINRKLRILSDKIKALSV